MKKNFFLKKIKINNLENIKIYTNNEIFSPNLTTNLLIEATKKVIKRKKKVLELGCGSGIISSYLYKKKFINKIYSSDLSQQSVQCSIKNAKYLNADYEIKCSDLFSNWTNERFDYIINDVSAISQHFNKITHWYKYSVNNSGVDGTKLTIKILDIFRDYLKKKGSLIFPIIGLSNKNKILNFIERKKIKCKLILSQEWPLPIELHKYTSLLLSLNKKNIIQVKKKLGFLTTKTEIFQCS
jgi:methylase of polypeptide subunit release factors